MEPPARSAADAFGVERPAWHRRLWARDAATPKRVGAAVAGVSALIVGFGGPLVHHSPIGFVLVALVLLVPGWALERHYRARRRRERERLLPKADRLSPARRGCRPR